MKLMRLFAALIGLLAAGHVRADPLEVGARAPAVAGTDQEGNSVELGELYEKGWVLVYFYPKAGTSGCTKQACSLRDAYETLAQRGVTVVGVSADGVAAQKDFQDEYKLPFTLLADPEKKVIRAFGVPTTMGFAARQAYLIRDGVVVWRDLKASTEKQAADVLAALDALAKPAG